MRALVDSKDNPRTAWIGVVLIAIALVALPFVLAQIGTAWVRITNLAILFGHELNAERERSAEIGEGKARADRELQLEPRSDPKEQRTT